MTNLEIGIKRKELEEEGNLTGDEKLRRRRPLFPRLAPAANSYPGPPSPNNPVPNEIKVGSERRRRRSYPRQPGALRRRPCWPHHR
jgi:hypothetical protein